MGGGGPSGKGPDITFSPPPRGGGGARGGGIPAGGVSAPELAVDLVEEILDVLGARPVVCPRA